MDSSGKHYRTMKNAVWLYLYFLLGANRRTGLLMRKIETISNDMGVTRDTALRWLKVLRSGGYIQTVNTGRSLTIQVTRWRALGGLGRSELQKLESSNSRYAKYPTTQHEASRPLPPRIGPVPSFAAAGNDTKIQINIVNDLHRSIPNKPRDRGFTRIGAGIQQEVLAQELAKELNDPAGINLYRSYSAKYPESLLREVLAKVKTLPPERITKGRGALFNYLVQHHDAKGATENPGH